MFYTKYRPQKFSEVAKPNDIALALSTQIITKKVGHAYLFVGPRGVGKTTIARILAKALNCKKITDKGDPCGKCDSCKSISSGSFMDLIEIDAASNRGIDDIRELKDKIKLTPSLGKQKVYIIDEVHMLTSEAFNALLKTLEEPPEHATFILCTTESHKVPETIKSRCMVYKFKRASLDQLVTKLSNIALEEKAKISKDDLIRIARASMGGYRDAETLLQQVIEGGLEVKSYVGREGKESLVEFVNYLIDKDTKLAIKQINEVFEDGTDLYTWTISLIHYLRDLLFISADASEGLIDVPTELFSFMNDQASKMSSLEVASMIELFSKAQLEIKSSVIPQLPVEVAIVKICDKTTEDEAFSEKSFGGDGGKGNGGSFGNTKRPSIFEKPSVGVRNIFPTKMAASTTLITTFEKIDDGWNDVVKAAKTHNHGVQALLKASRPKNLDGNLLVVEVFYKFHKERLETPSNRAVVEDVLKEIFEEPIRFSCVLSDDHPKINKKYESGDLTDFNVTVPLNIPIGESLVNVFDGALPL
ncbi:DNA polymerase III subunit gamma/tau [candidate division WWE3 bacterium]|nr:DNA polymerase III subunit gamma/tau [candidate division WWE3 bacterium]